MCGSHYDKWRDTTPARIAYKKNYKPVRSSRNREYKKQWQKNFRKTPAYREYIDRYYSREDVQRRLKNYQKSDKARMSARASRLKKEYGITPGDYDKMLLRQDGKCFVCGAHGGRRLHIDHDHKTGKVRALLCAQDNQALGLLKDDPRRIRRLAEYAEDHRAA